MIIWIAIILPLLLAGVIYAIWNHRITWWELALQITIPILMVAVAKGCVESEQTKAIEYWGFYVTSAAYFERWNEKVHCRHPHMVEKTGHRTVTDSKGKSRRESYTYYVQEGWEHPYDIDDHDPYWEAYVSSGSSISISQSAFERLCSQFRNREFVDLHRHFWTINGNKYFTAWKNEWEQVEPVAEEHTYENRVQASHSVFNFQTVNPKDYGLFEHPRISGHQQQCILGDAGPSAGLGEKKIEYVNSIFGRSKQVRIYILIFKNQPIQAAMEQEAYWKAGNKNEFTTCIGVDDEYNVQWCHVFSWTEVDSLKIEARSFVMDQKILDLVGYGQYLEKVIPEKWQRKHFKEFNYLTVDPPLKAVIWTFIVTLVVSGGLGAWSVLNPFDTGRKRFQWSGAFESIMGKGKEGRP